MPARCDLAFLRERLAAHQPQTISAEVAPRRAAVAVMLRELDPQGTSCAALFIRRAQHPDDPWSGHMAFPGGRVDPGDLSPLEAARRETHEEVGLDLTQDAELLGAIDDLRASARGTVLPLAITPFVFRWLGSPESLRPNHEVEEALWIPIARLLDPASSSTVPYELGGQRYELPCFDIDGRIIWGLTYQMLMRLFVILGWERPRCATPPPR